MKTFRYIIVAILAFAGATQASAQYSTSAYSRIGYGMLGENATGTQRQMGGVGYAMSGNRSVNSMNPASYATTDSLTFLWEIGADASQLWAEENGTKGNSFGGGLDYINASFRVAKNVGMSFGVVPFSSVGYQFGNDITYGTETRAGEGAISELYLGAGWSPIKNLSVGANVSYMFGTLDNYTYIYSTGTSFFDRTMEIRDWNLHIGAQYSYDLNRKDRVTVGAVFSPKKSFHGHTWGTYYDASSDTKLDTVSYKSLKGNYEQPNTFGLGVNYKHGNQLMGEIDFTYQDWSKAKYTSMTYYEQADMKFDNRWKVAAGVQYVPDERGSYFKRVAYRLGAFYNHDYQNISGNNVRDYGLSLGFGFPALGSKSIVNLGFEWKHRTTSPAVLIKENYLNITLSLTFNEMWFWQNKLR